VLVEMAVIVQSIEMMLIVVMVVVGDDIKGGAWGADRISNTPGPRHPSSGSFHSSPSHHT
jgi:hypothetical protein